MTFPDLIDVDSYQLQLRDPFKACIVLLRLIFLIMAVATHDTSTIAFRSVGSHLSWALDCLTQLHVIITRSEGNSGFWSCQGELILPSIRVLRQTLQRVRGTQSQSSGQLKAAALLSQLEAWVIEQPVVDLNSRLQNELSLGLLETAQAAGSSELCASGVNCVLLPTMLKLAADDEGFALLSADLRVGVSCAAITGLSG